MSNRGGGCMIMIRDNMPAIELITCRTLNDSFDVCAMATGRLHFKVLKANA